MPVRLLIPGQPDPVAATGVRGGAVATPRAAQTDLLQGVAVVAAYSLSPAARAKAAGEPAAVEVEDDDVLAFEIDGVTFWTSVERYRHEQALYRPHTVTDAGVMVEGVARPSAAERGIRDWAAGAVRVLRLGRDTLADELQDPALRAEFARDMGLTLSGRIGGWLLTKLLVWSIERRLRPREGLYTWNAATQAIAPGQPDPAPAHLADHDPRTPILVFLHGTASSTRGSFGAFLTPDAAAEWRALTGMFGTHIYGFEHRTMSRSPIENAIALAEALPARAQLSLVSHSRGGLIGDLLCLSGLSAEQIGTFVRSDGDLAEADALDRTALQRLAEVLRQRQFTVQRFLRCASPSRGTLLASENLDEFLSLLTNLVGLVPALAASPLYEVITRITLEAARNRWRPATLPGIEAMIPSSPLVRLLNARASEAAGMLGVVAGDIQGGHLFKRLGVFITDRFLYENRDNDLVVNTDSMFHGARRPQAHYVYDQGADVSHFNYFNNARTRTQMARWLTAAGSTVPQGFRDVAEGEVRPVPMTRSIDAVVAAARPVVMVLPGLMGSTLSVDGRQVWPDVDALAAGQLGTLEDADNDAVSASALLADVYGDLCDSLAGSHEVLPWPYDWRRSLRATADRLDADVKSVLKRTAVPVRLVAHGMGGCVVRVWMDRHADTWRTLAEREGSRVVLLGAPHRGTFDSVQLLLGTHPVVQQLALLDPARGHDGVVAMVQQWPGVLELLPQSPAVSRADVHAWRGLRAGVKVAAPSADRLRSAAAVQDFDASAPLPHADRIFSVSGTAARTPTAVVERDGTLLLEVTTEGDGRVTYDSSRLPGVTNAFADVAHGDLPATSMLPALGELLTHGRTTRLFTTSPNDARGGAVESVMRPEPVLYPTGRALEQSALGHRATVGDRREEGTGGFRVSVVYGDLRFARYPVMVGHYEGDTIVGAESQIDWVLDGALTTRYNLGLYPGAAGTVAVIIRQPTPLQQSLQLMSGAIVMGLGRWGELTAGQIANLVRKGALQYVLQLDDIPVSSTGEQAGARERVGLSVLLIGSTSTANISIDDSVAAVLRGIAQANRELESRLPDLHRCIEDIEIIELYADTAITAAKAAARLAPLLTEELGVPIEAEPLLKRGRHGRVRLTGASNVDAWRRWEITAHTPARALPVPLPGPVRDRVKRALTDGGPPDEPLMQALVELAFDDQPREASTELRFVSLSDRARAEVMMQQRQPELIERLVSGSVGQTAFRPQDARALFELMVPNDLKDGMGQLARVVFVVDEETARYPWELMSDGGAPLCTRIGMVRQLQTARFRPQIRVTTARTAYVVGDPLVAAPFRQLPGARQEATVVADLLEGNGFTPTRRDDRPTALDVLAGLFQQPYRIVHLAGHGHYESPTGPREYGRSGMVLDGGVFLTAVEIGQMQQVPELVFLNCCFIGQTGPESVGDTRGVPYNRLAASVSRELIEMGVRAVVAAGWAVRDDAALHYARVFYGQMLGGATFGRALQEARAQTHQQFPDSNTWGAYQAYGDPDFRLERGDAGRTRGPRVAHEELLETLADVRRQAYEHGQWTARGGDSPVTLPDVRHLEALLESTPPTWLSRSDVLMALGTAYGELSVLPKAIEYISAALQTGELDNCTTLKAVEQLANFEARHAAKDADALTDAEARQARTTIEQAIGRLEALHAIAQTSERHSLLGSAYKNLARVSRDPDEVKAALQRSADSYRRAHEHAAGSGITDPYPLVNWLSLTAMLGKAEATTSQLLEQAAAAARARFAAARDPYDAVFDAITLPDISVARALATGTFAKSGKERDQEISAIVAEYQETFRRTCATSRQVDSAVSQLTFLAKMQGAIAEGASGDRMEKVRAALDDIRTQLGGKPTPPSPTPPPDDPTPAPRKKKRSSTKGPRKPRMS